VFIAIFKILIQNEKAHTATTNKKGVVAKPINVKAKENPIKETIKGILLSNLDTNHPEMGNPIKELIGIAKSTVPSSASLKLKSVLIVGIRDAQVAKLRPVRKK